MPVINKKSGLSLIEVVIMLFIVGTTITLAANLSVSSINTTITNRNLVVAENIATEAAEAISNLVYTNILRYGRDNIAECWFVYTQEVANAANCANSEILATINDAAVSGRLTRNYNLETPDLHWQFSDPQQSLDLENNEEGASFYLLYQAPLDNTPGSPLANTKYYSHNELIPNAEPTPFYRGVTFTPVDNGQNSIDEVTYTITVQWRENSDLRTITKVGNINYRTL